MGEVLWIFGLSAVVQFSCRSFSDNGLGESLDHVQLLVQRCLHLRHHDLFR